MTTRLQYLYENDNRALSDFIICNGMCNDCRAHSYCLDYRDQEEDSEHDLKPWEFLLGEVGPGETMSVADRAKHAS